MWCECYDFSCYTIYYSKVTACYPFSKFSYLYEIARRHPYFYAPELLYYAHKYKEVLKECCSSDDKAACMTPKVLLVKMIEPIHTQVSELQR